MPSIAKPLASQPPAATTVVRTASTPLAVAPAEAARLAGVGRTTLYAALKSGALPSLKLGRRRLVRLDALETWLNAHAA